MPAADAKCCRKCGRWGVRGFALTHPDQADGQWTCTNDAVCKKRAASSGPSFADVVGVTTRAYVVTGERSEMGRSSLTVRCPFCDRSVTVYLWSLYGGGKRCDCGALFDRFGTAHHWASRFPDDTLAKDVTL